MKLYKRYKNLPLIPFIFFGYYHERNSLIYLLPYG